MYFKRFNSKCSFIEKIVQQNSASVTPVQRCEVRLVRMESNGNTSPLTALPIVDSNSNAELDHEDDRDEVIPPTPPSNHRYRTRSSMNATNDTEACTRPVREKKGPAPPRPKPSFIEYKGKVEYHTDLHDIANMSHELL